MAAQEIPTHCVGRNAKTIRELKGLKQGDVAAKTGISQSQLSKFERGMCDLILDKVLELARVLGVTLQHLLELGLGGRTYTYQVSPAPVDMDEEVRRVKLKR